LKKQKFTNIIYIHELLNDAELNIDFFFYKVSVWFIDIQNAEH